MCIVPGWWGSELYEILREVDMDGQKREETMKHKQSSDFNRRRAEYTMGSSNISPASEVAHLHTRHLLPIPFSRHFLFMSEGDHHNPEKGRGVLYR